MPVPLAKYTGRSCRAKPKANKKQAKGPDKANSAEQRMKIQ